MDAVARTIYRDLEIAPEPSSENEIFVIMAASDDLKPLYAEAIEPAITDNSMVPFLMVVREPAHSISDAILEHIELAGLLIADLTHERPNCYYEAGYAHAKGKKIIFTARADHDPRRADRKPGDPKVHFDLDSHRFSFWKADAFPALREELRQRIAESLRIMTAGTTASARRGEIGEMEILKLMRETQAQHAGTIVVPERAIAQELGWPLQDVELNLKRILEKGLVQFHTVVGYSLKR